MVDPHCNVEADDLHHSLCYGHGTIGGTVSCGSDRWGSLVMGAGEGMRAWRTEVNVSHCNGGCNAGNDRDLWGSNSGIFLCSHGRSDSTPRHLASHDLIDRHMISGWKDHVDWSFSGPASWNTSHVGHWSHFCPFAEGFPYVFDAIDGTAINSVLLGTSRHPWQ